MEGRAIISAQRRSPLLDWLSLFGSLGTLLCCALPSLLVLVGLGATVASLLSMAPWLVTLSRHKGWVFALSGVLIGANLVYVYLLVPRLRARGDSCGTGGSSACDPVTATSRVLLWISLAVYAVGFFTAFLLGPMLTLG